MKNKNTSLKLDPSRLLGFRLATKEAKAAGKLGACLGSKAGAKVGSKGGGGGGGQPA